jgi:bifunctional non-homologous end joining protein LigD
MVSTVDGLRVRSRRGWNMTMQLLELADLPADLVLDGEIVAFNHDGLPHWPLVCQRLLHGDGSVVPTFVAFDVLRVDGHDLICNAWSDRRAVLDERAADAALPRRRRLR